MPPITHAMDHDQYHQAYAPKAIEMIAIIQADTT
jgi:hypothetical protein